MRLTQKLQIEILDNLNDGVYLVDRDRRITFWNKAAEDITGFTSDEVIGHQCWDDILTHVNEKGVSLCQGLCPTAITISTGNLQEANVYLRHKHGHMVPIIVRTCPIRDENGSIVGAAEIFNDFSEKIAAFKRIKELESLGCLDFIAGLANKHYIEMCLKDTCDHLMTFGWSYGAIMISVDNLAEVAESEGRQIADELLVVIAQTLINRTWARDTIGRWANEKFVVLLANVDKVKVLDAAESFRALVEKSSIDFEDHHTVNGVTSIGATLAVEGDTPESIIERLEKLVEKAGSSGKNQICRDFGE